jgi:hypothetical protein
MGMRGLLGNSAGSRRGCGIRVAQKAEGEKGQIRRFFPFDKLRVRMTSEKCNSRFPSGRTNNEACQIVAGIVRGIILR